MNDGVDTSVPFTQLDAWCVMDYWRAAPSARAHRATHEGKKTRLFPSPLHSHRESRGGGALYTAAVAIFFTG